MKLATLRGTRLYSEELDIDLSASADTEYFKWFLASILFGSRISETIANKTYRTFERHQLLTPEQIIDAGWDFLVDPIMREGGYVRYDRRKSTQVLRNSETLVTEYEGSLSTLHSRASDPPHLEKLLLDFWGVGPVTVNIFLRELRPWWRNADPEPLGIISERARNLGLDLDAIPRKSLTFARVEAGLIRMR